MFAEAIRHRSRVRSPHAELQSCFAEDTFLTSTFPSTEPGAHDLAPIEKALSALDRSADETLPSLTLLEGQRAVLDSDPTKRSLVEPVMLRTRSIDEFKSWIGVSNAVCRARPEPNSYWDMPEARWSGRRVASPEEFTAQERADIERAGWVYLFCDSDLVADYREAIEYSRGMFEAAVYRIDALTVLPGARLQVGGAPAIVVCNRLELHAPGQIAMYTPCHAHFGSVRKFHSARSAT